MNLNWYIDYIFFPLVTGFLINYLLTKEFITHLGATVFQIIRSKKVFLETHVKGKQHTPTLGGLPMLVSLILTVLFTADWKNGYILVLLFTAIVFALIGFIDDFIKLRFHNVRGFKGSIKLVLELLLTLLIIFVMLNHVSGGAYLISSWSVPFSNNWYIPWGSLYVAVGVFVVVGASNGNNLTDGLDGLDIVPVMLNMLVFAVIAVITGEMQLAEKFHVEYLPGSLEIVKFVIAIIGVGLGFLCFNRHPAKIFMGDTGSLMLGALMGVIAIALKHELTFAIAGLLFVIESLSTIIQLTSMKFFHRRVFEMAPIHHHFEKKGWSEVKVVKTFWCFSVICCIVAITSIFIKF